MEDQERLTQALAASYRIEREIGSGGMATVYLAQDLKHDRQVAVKVLDSDLAQSLGAERFLREIKTAANLTHPHILPLHDSGDADGFLYFVMPYVKGESLRARLTKEKQLPVEDAIQITREIADALAYAHEEGIIHRDVKPANIMLEAGHAVLADFGVAQAVAEAGETRITKTGVSLGTPPYMSPEQASGESDLDGRTDLYALACVLYEMLVGQPPFSGATTAQVLARKLSAPPPSIHPVRPSVGPELDELIGRALRTTPADRFQSVPDFLTALRSIQLGDTVGGSPSHPSFPRTEQRRWLLWSLAAVSVVSVALAALAFLTGGPGPPAEILLPVSRQVTFDGGILEATMSRDGRFIAYRTGQGQNRIWVQELAGGNPVEVFTTSEFLCCMAFSPDGSRLVFNVGGRAAGSTVILPRLGGPSPRPVDADVISIWSPDGTQLASWWPQATHIRITEVASGELVDSVAIGVDHGWVLGADWSPDGRFLAVALGAGQKHQLWTLEILTGRITMLLEGGDLMVVGPRWSPLESAIYFWGGLDFFKLRVGRNGEVKGDPVLISAEHSRSSYNPSVPVFSISDDLGQMAYRRSQGFSNLAHYTVDTLTRLTADQRWLTGGTNSRFTPRVSPDGEWVVYTETGTGGWNLLLGSIHGGSPRQLTFEAESAWSPAWSPDGRFIAYYDARDEKSISVITFEGDETEAFPIAARFAGEGIAWAPLHDLVYKQDGDQGFRTLDLDDAEDQLLFESGHWMYDPCPSPDGELLAYRGTGGPNEFGLWVGPLPDGPFNRLNDSITGPVGWEPDGEAIFALPVANIRDASDVIYRVPLDSSTPTLWFRFPPGEAATSRNVSITPDGLGFVAAVFRSEYDVVVIENPDPTVRR